MIRPETKPPMKRWRCLECGATGEALTYRQRLADLHAHWAAEHNAVEF